MIESRDCQTAFFLLFSLLAILIHSGDSKINAEKIYATRQESASKPNQVRPATGVSNSRSEQYSSNSVGNIKPDLNSRYTNSSSILTRQDSRQSYDQSGDTRIPFWNIAHMINSIDAIEPALREGANGIEVDISFDKYGLPVESYHGFPCDCGRHCFDREDLVKFVRHVAHLTAQIGTSNLQLIVFDLKLKDLSAQQKQVGGRQLAVILHENLYQPYQAIARQQRELVVPPVRSIVSINHVQDSVFVRAFLEYMMEKRLNFMGNHVGFDVGMNDDLNEINSMWNSFHGATLNIWQGDGLTNCANIIRGVDRLKDAISNRNSQGHFRKIYYWTADIMYQIRSVLRLGVDAILTNQPQRLIQVLDEPEFRNKYRLATPYDDPFAQYLIQPSNWKMSLPTIDELSETVTNIKRTSANFVKTLPDGIAAVLKKVQNSIVPSS